MTTLITVELDGECFFTNTAFPGWFGDAEEGEEYLSQWGCYAKGENGERYKVYWEFLVTKGEEPDDDDLPWDDESCVNIVRVD